MSPTAPHSYVGRVLAAVAIVALAWLAWQLLDVLIIVFGAILVATALRTLAAPLRRRFGLSARAAIAMVIVIGLTLLGAGSWLVGDQLVEQFGTLRERLPRALDDVMRWLEGNPVGSTLIEVWDNAKEDGGVAFARVASFATITIGAVGGVLLMLFAGIYLAADPRLYVRGVLRLLPPAQRGRVDAAMEAAGDALSRWLLGQAVTMLMIGVLTAVGLALLGIPLALMLGAITGLLAFVPFFGSVTGGVLVVLLAFTQGPEHALYAALLFVGIQQAEEFLILPYAQRWAVRMPPVLGLVSVLVFGLLFGPLGALFATPLMVVVMVLVQRLYIHDVVENGTAQPDAAHRLPGPAP